MSPIPADHPVTRRAGLRLAATGTAGLAVAGLAGLSPALASGPGGAPTGTVGRPAGGSGPVPASGPGTNPSGAAPVAGETAHVAVTATTLWVDPRTERPEIDGPSLTTPVDLDAWNANMQETETRRWLTGMLESQAVLGSEVIVDEIDGTGRTSSSPPRAPRAILAATPAGCRRDTWCATPASPAGPRTARRRP